MAHKLIIITLFFILSGLMLYRAIVLTLNGFDVFGKSPINIWFYAFCKTSLLISWFLFLLKAFNITVMDDLITSNLFAWLGVLFLTFGSTLILLPFFQLKECLRMGLNKNQNNKLVTTGIYSISRNPMYLGFFLTCIGSVFYTMNILNILCSAIAIGVHHFIVQAEEKSLEKNCSTEWAEYKVRVRRYL